MGADGVYFPGIVPRPQYLAGLLLGVRRAVTAYLGEDLVLQQLGTVDPVVQ